MSCTWMFNIVMYMDVQHCHVHGCSTLSCTWMFNIVMYMDVQHCHVHVQHCHVHGCSTLSCTCPTLSCTWMPSIVMYMDVQHCRVHGCPALPCTWMPSIVASPLIDLDSTLFRCGHWCRAGVLKAVDQGLLKQVHLLPWNADNDFISIAVFCVRHARLL